MKVGGNKPIITPEGHIIPVDIYNGLPCITMRPYTDKEFENLTHVILTNGLDWDQHTLDCSVEDSEDWFNAVSHLQDDSCISHYDEFENCIKRVHIAHAEQQIHLETCIDDDVMYHTF